MAKRRSQSKKTTNTEQQKIVYDDQIEAKSSTISTKIEGSSEAVVISSEAKVSKAKKNKLVEETTTNSVQENTESKSSSSEQKTKCCPFSESFLTTTLVTVRIIGDKNKNGLHHMCVKAVAKAVATNMDVNRIILTSAKTGEDIYHLVKYHPDRIDATNIPQSVRNILAERFKNNLKRYKF